MPIRMFNDCGSPAPGWVEMDFVAHGGTTVSGAFAQTMATDVATGWTECIPIMAREAEMAVHAFGHAREVFPFPLRRVDVDNDSLFTSNLIVGGCRTKQGTGEMLAQFLLTSAIRECANRTAGVPENCDFARKEKGQNVSRT